MVHRLPPQPTDTALARLVARLVRRWPFAWSKTVRSLDTVIARQGQEICNLHIVVSEIQDDFTEMTLRFVPSIPLRPSVAAMDHELHLDRLIRVNFEPVHMRLTGHDIRREYSTHGKELMKHAAARLARHHAHEAERLILEQILQVDARISAPDCQRSQ